MASWMRGSLIVVLAFTLGCSGEGGKRTNTKRTGKGAAKAAAATRTTGGPDATKPAPAPGVEPAARTGKRPDDDDPHPRVEMKTSLGVIGLELDRQRAPITVENFLRYVEARFYDGTIFHRVIPTFMIQGGGFTVDGRKKRPLRPPIKNESPGGLGNARGTIAMARTADPDSATAQFYINVVDNPNLDYPNAGGHGYAVFGKVVEGMDVVDAIRNVKTAPRGRLARRPVKDVVIESVRRR